MATLKPSEANFSVMAFPIPFVAPVITAFISAFVFSN
jgi:hypothetical protein